MKREKSTVLVIVIVQLVRHERLADRTQVILAKNTFAIRLLLGEKLAMMLLNVKKLSNVLMVKNESSLIGRKHEIGQVNGIGDSYVIVYLVLAIVLELTEVV